MSASMLSFLVSYSDSWHWVIFYRLLFRWSSIVWCWKQYWSYVKVLYIFFVENWFTVYLFLENLILYMMAKTASRKSTKILEEISEPKILTITSRQIVLYKFHCHFLFLFISLLLKLADKLAHRTCLLVTDGLQIRPARFYYSATDGQ